MFFGDLNLVGGWKLQIKSKYEKTSALVMCMPERSSISKLA
jgi:hypothetical protein